MCGGRTDPSGDATVSFMQCEYRYSGGATNLAEIELILATTTTLGRIGFKNFNIRINDRQILKAMAAYSGFAEEDYDQVFIILDKMDKIGRDGVETELLEAGFSKDSVGKYLALLTVYLIPLCVIAVYPLIFSQFGDVYLLTSYGSILAFFLMGAALIALGVFISSLTDNQGFAAGIGIAVILLNYYSVSLSEYVSSTVFGSVAALCVLVLALGAVIKYLTKTKIWLTLSALS